MPPKARDAEAYETPAARARREGREREYQLKYSFLFALNDCLTSCWPPDERLWSARVRVIARMLGVPYPDVKIWAETTFAHWAVQLPDAAQCAVWAEMLRTEARERGWAIPSWGP